MRWAELRRADETNNGESNPSSWKTGSAGESAFSSESNQLSLQFLTFTDTPVFGNDGDREREGESNSKFLDYTENNKNQRKVECVIVSCSAAVVSLHWVHYFFEFHSPKCSNYYYEVLLMVIPSPIRYLAWWANVAERGDNLWQQTFNVEI